MSYSETTLSVKMLLHSHLITSRFEVYEHLKKHLNI